MPPTSLFVPALPDCPVEVLRDKNQQLDHGLLTPRAFDQHLPGDLDGTLVFVDQQYDPKDFETGRKLPGGLHILRGVDLESRLGFDVIEEAREVAGEEPTNVVLTPGLFEQALRGALDDPSLDLRVLGARSQPSKAATFIFGVTTDWADSLPVV
ncbi:MAG TPA: hypothetical protein VK674_03800 [Candidatus Limnocylindria bacterium]|nr:hypothetical protein [Candidatus Limnocylindria bacterium]